MALLRNFRLADQVLGVQGELGPPGSSWMQSLIDGNTTKASDGTLKAASRS
ncbi:hypothetical protein ABKS86_07835 [Enterobacter cloacae]